MRLRGVVFVAALLAAIIGVPAGPAPAAPPAGTPVNQLYYTVTASYQGAPENLWEIATRFLGDTGRAGEILDLNSGRIQPDGGRLSDPSRLRAGWHLLLPWDAVGAELHFGPLPGGTKASPDCERKTRAPAAASWGQTLLTPGRAWPVANGSGVKVAIVGSGVDGSAAELAGRVAAGTDIAGGSGRGDTGCDGSGTALAGIVAGNDGAGGKVFGVAPGARIVPIKVGGAQALPRLAATGIDVAARSGAKVVLVAAGVDGTDPKVRAAIGDAISRDVVVVLPAPAGAEKADGLLRVGAIAADRRPADDYPDGAVDLLAPGVGVATGGRAASGAEYAAAFVAGTVALIRSAHPELHAADVTKQALATVTDKVVAPVAAVTTPLPAGVGVNAAPVEPSSGPGTLTRVLLWGAVGLALLLLLPFLLKRPLRMLARAQASHRANRLARQTRARMAADNDDPFWDPPAGAPGRPAGASGGTAGMSGGTAGMSGGTAGMPGRSAGMPGALPGGPDRGAEAPGGAAGAPGRPENAPGRPSWDEVTQPSPPVR